MTDIQGLADLCDRSGTPCASGLVAEIVRLTNERDEMRAALAAVRDWIARHPYDSVPHSGQSLGAVLRDHGAA